MLYEENIDISILYGTCHAVLGYIRNNRFDTGRIDPNRDFSYVRNGNSKDCLQSNTGKLFNALMTETLIQSVITFHGGMIASKSTL